MRESRTEYRSALLFSYMDWNEKDALASRLDKRSRMVKYGKRQEDSRIDRC